MTAAIAAYARAKAKTITAMNVCGSWHQYILAPPYDPDADEEASQPSYNASDSRREST